MALYLYEVQLSRGLNHKKFKQFDEAIYQYAPVSIGYGGNSAFSVISHHMDIETIRADLLSCLNQREQKDLRMSEITADTLRPDGEHFSRRDMVENYFLRNNRRGYPNIPKIPPMDDDEEE